MVDRGLTSTGLLRFSDDQDRARWKLVVIDVLKAYKATDLSDATLDYAIGEHGVPTSLATVKAMRDSGELSLADLR